MMDSNQTFIQFPAAGFAPPFVPGFRSFSISSGREDDGELDKSLSNTDIVIFLDNNFRFYKSVRNIWDTITMVPPNNKIWDSVLSKGMKGKVVFCPIVTHFGKTDFLHY